MAGGSMGRGLNWRRRTPAKLAAFLRADWQAISARIVGRLLKSPRSRRPRRAVRELGPAGQTRHRRRRQLWRHPGLRGQVPRALVTRSRSPPPSPRLCANRARRFRRQPRLPSPGLEIRPPAPPARSVPPDRDRRPLPPERSQWNPIEHRLFSFISRNQAGHPLDSFQTILNSIRRTVTRPGLRVEMDLLPDTFSTGVKIQDEAMQQLNPIPADDLST